MRKIPNKTKNYNLTLPLQEEFYDVDVFNENAEVIDEELGKVSTKVNSLAAVAITGKYNNLIDKPCVVCKNAEELKEALNAEARNVFLMPGNYEFTGLLNIFYPVNIKGCGDDTVIKFSGGKLAISGDYVNIEKLRIVKNDSGNLLDITVTSGYDGTGKDLRFRDCSFKCDGESGMICKTNALGKMFFFDGCVFDFGGALIYNGLSNAYSNVSGFISNSYATENVYITNEISYSDMLIINGCFNITKQM